MKKLLLTALTSIFYLAFFGQSDIIISQYIETSSGFGNTPTESNEEPPCHPDIEALLALYNATDGPNWANNTGWVDGVADADCDPCNWYGVTCDGENQVTELDLNYNMLVGSFPAELGQLSSLIKLNLSSNLLLGSIPLELSQLTSLTHLISENTALSGPIPPELGELSSLERLVLSYNLLSGPIPPELGELSALTHLFLDRNQLSGPIPPELGEISLSTIWLYDNNLSGCIPRSFLSFCETTQVDIGSNPLLDEDYFVTFCNDSAGICPPCHPDIEALIELYNSTDGPNWNNNAGWADGAAGTDCTPCNWYGIICDDDDRVVELDLNNNQLVGIIAPELGQLSSLTTLYLNDNSLTGSIPHELGELSTLTTLWLTNNNLTGCISPSFQSLCGEANVDVTANPLLENEDFSTFCSNETGECPYYCHPDLDGLLALYNSTNGANWLENSGWEDGAQGTDCTPCEWFGVLCDKNNRVTRVWLSYNSLYGTIPPELSQLTSLTVLRLNNNDLTGTIPIELSQLSNLSELLLSKNELSGHIPTELSQLSSLTKLYLWGNELTGCIPSSFQSFCLGVEVELSLNPMMDNDNFSTFCSSGVGECQTSCATDFNIDGETSGKDFTIFLGNYNFPCINPFCPTDLNGDGITNGEDCSIFLGSYGLMCD